MAGQWGRWMSGSRWPARAVSRSGAAPRNLTPMPSTPPVGDPVPPDGSLPGQALDGLADTPLGFYLHVPFCAVRCGYCDFNTYSPDQLDVDAVSVWARSAHTEIDLAARVLGDRSPRLSTVFIGGGTPTMVPPALLTGLIQHLRDFFGLLPDAEVTTEANPETITPPVLEALLEGGISRLSLGMQSSVPHVLRVLDRVHTPGRALEAVRLARAAGFADISLDLIYGTPGESLGDWRASLDAALGVAPDHLSAYALIVEDGTALAARIRRGALAGPDDDDLADKYLAAEEVLTSAGYAWYEVSNWSRGTSHRSRHNLAYWRSHHWWGVGPGAHSHVGGVRWWNVRHPRRYGALLAEGRSPGEGREVLHADQRRVERVLLELRIADGLPAGVLTDTERGRVPALVDDGLLVDHPDAAPEGRLVLTLRGRLLADAVVRRLLD